MGRNTNYAKEKKGGKVCTCFYLLSLCFICTITFFFKPSIYEEEADSVIFDQSGKIISYKLFHHLLVKDKTKPDIKRIAVGDLVKFNEEDPEELSYLVVALKYYNSSRAYVLILFYLFIFITLLLQLALKKQTQTFFFNANCTNSQGIFIISLRYFTLHTNTSLLIHSLIYTL